MIRQVNILRRQRDLESMRKKELAQILSKPKEESPFVEKELECDKRKRDSINDSRRDDFSSKKRKPQSTVAFERKEDVDFSIRKMNGKEYKLRQLHVVKNKFC